MDLLKQLVGRAPLELFYDEDAKIHWRQELPDGRFIHFQTENDNIDYLARIAQRSWTAYDEGE